MSEETKEKLLIGLAMLAFITTVFAIGVGLSNESSRSTMKATYYEETRELPPDFHEMLSVCQNPNSMTIFYKDKFGKIKSAYYRGGNMDILTWEKKR